LNNLHCLDYLWSICIFCKLQSINLEPYEHICLKLHYSKLLKFIKFSNILLIWMKILIDPLEYQNLILSSLESLTMLSKWWIPWVGGWLLNSLAHLSLHINLMFPFAYYNCKKVYHSQTHEYNTNKCNSWLTFHNLEEIIFLETKATMWITLKVNL
jgi:hypothetical protein